MVEYKLGSIKNLDQITIDEQKEYKIWVNDLSGESESGFDESSIRPLLECDKITKTLIGDFFLVYILVKIVDTEIYGSAIVSEAGNLETIAIWYENSWKEIEDIYSNDKKIYLENLVPIFDENNCVFEYEYGKGRCNAYRKH
ncbi:MAG: hypothetical protein LBI28_07910 [Treponema sp.]|jgi:hypothetical protein|nr:hypothetical protein [Treponema sp.]